MKKSLMTMIAAMLLTTSLQAQQIINSCDLKDGYLPYAWTETPIDILSGGIFGDENELLMKAKYYYVDDAVPVYGIAAGLATVNPGEETYPHVILDTSRNNAFEYFTLYKSKLDTIGLVPVSDSLKIHLRDTPVSYYMNLICGAEHTYYDGIEQELIIPVYERYFDSVYWMTDSFYVGMTHRSAYERAYDSTGRYYLYSSWPVKIFFFLQSPAMSIGDIWVFHYDWSALPPEVIPMPEWYYNIPRHGDNRVYFLFPILTPPDTTGTGEDGDDSLAVQQVQLVDRLVAVQPNPATERVKVVASCGMERLTAYNAAGVKVHEQPATGLSATLNVQGWPAGTYILHIQTPMGVSTKRLVVAR